MTDSLSRVLYDLKRKEPPLLSPALMAHVLNNDDDNDDKKVNDDQAETKGDPGLLDAASLLGSSHLASLVVNTSVSPSKRLKVAPLSPVSLSPPPPPDRQAVSEWGTVLAPGWRPVVVVPDALRVLTRRDTAQLSLRQLPGRLPHALRRARLPQLRQREWYCAEKTDGMRGVLVVSQGRVFLQGRKGHWFEGPRLSRPCGTAVLDGEYLESPPGTRRFLVFDALYTGQINWRNSFYVDRLAAARAVLVSDMLDVLAPAVGAVSLKDVRVARQPWCRELAARIKKDAAGVPLYQAPGVSHHTDGLVFTPARAGYDESEPLKFKWIHTVDFVIAHPASLLRPVPLLVRLEQNAEHRFAELELDLEEQSRVHAELEESGSHRCVVECAYDPQKGRWVLKGFRPDKIKGNFITVAVDTLALTAEHLTLREVREALKP
jgi:hypothetical protein